MHAQPSALRVAIVEDQPLFREMLQHLLSSVPRLHVRSAQNVTEASLWDPREFDVALLDYELPDGTGLELGQAFQQKNSELGVVLLSAVDRTNALLDVAQHERWSYLSKTSSTSARDLVRTVKMAAAGRTVIDPQVVARREPRAGSRLAELSPRQYVVLTHIAEGLTNQAIADELGLAVNSVNNHVNAVYSGLGLTDNTQNPRVRAVRIFLEDSV